MEREATESALEELDRLRVEIYELRKRLRPAARRSLPESPFHVLICALEEVRIAFCLSAIHEVVPIAWLSRLPEAPVWIPGFLALRGEAVPVIDVAARVQRRRREAELGDLVVVVSYGERKIGLMVGEVYEVRTFDPDGIQPASEELPHAPYLRGVWCADAEPVLLVDTDNLISLSDLPEIDS